ncbi:Gldg family protein [Phormidium sp. CLA17]|uniref:GldG family protein n=1 Tax=Leptolyngbya sp. Cla-17 TaxID=2803751 RepID=UPI00149113CF|nr:Gldg family protein [Leptolyngbya sp. Cla-17]MBM0743394.1 Gldg family protein [Leptolyngbya sp. Cla-17]
MKSFRPFLKYLFWFAPMLVVAGLTVGVVSGSWGALPVVLMVVGVAIAGLGLLALGSTPSDQPEFWRRRSTEAGANTLVSTLAVLVILGLINFLGAKSVWRFDLTENQQFTLAPQTQELVRSLPQPIKVWVFDKQQNPQDRELLESYRRLGKQFSFEYVDPQAVPSLAKQLEVKKIGEVILERSPNQRKQFVQAINAQERLSEVKLTNAIEQINSDRKSTVYFLQGHGERAIDSGQGAMDQAVKQLGDKNFVGKPLTLATSSEFPQDADVVVVAGPQKPLLAAEVTALKTYLDKGGNLLLLIDPTNPDPKLEPLLNEWGVSLDKRVTIDASGGGKLINLGPADALVSQFGEHPITKDLQGNLAFFSLARPLGIKEVTGVKATPLLFTNDKSWAESNLKSQPLQYDAPADQQGPLVLGFALTRSVKEKTTESRLVVIGNSSFVANGLLEQVANGDVFFNSVRWLSQQEQPTLALRPKDAKNRRINLTTQQASLASWLALAILPLLAFGTAIAVWWKRR